MRGKFGKFVRNEDGVTAIEAGLAGAILSIAAVAAAETLGEGSVITYARAAIAWMLG